MDNNRLEELLQRSKRCQGYLDKWESEGPIDRLPWGTTLSETVKDSWKFLHKAIREAVPCKLSLESGEIIYAVRVGVLTDDLWMHCGTRTADLKFLIDEVHLESITSIEKVEIEE